MWMIIGAFEVIAYFDSESFGGVPSLGLCGPSFRSDSQGLGMVLIPLMSLLVLYLLITPFSLRLIVRHIHHESSYGLSLKNTEIKSDFIHLLIRLIIYSVCIALSCAVLCTVNIIGITYSSRMYKLQEDYLSCLLAHGEANAKECKLGIAISAPIYYSEGVVCAFLACGSFVLSCTTRRMKSVRYSKCCRCIIDNCEWYCCCSCWWDSYKRNSRLSIINSVSIDDYSDDDDDQINFKANKKSQIQIELSPDMRACTSNHEHYVRLESECQNSQKS